MNFSNSPDDVSSFLDGLSYYDIVSNPVLEGQPVAAAAVREEPLHVRQARRRQQPVSSDANAICVRLPNPNLKQLTASLQNRAGGDSVGLSPSRRFRFVGEDSAGGSRTAGASMLEPRVGAVPVRFRPPHTAQQPQQLPSLRFQHLNVIPPKHHVQLPSPRHQQRVPQLIRNLQQLQRQPPPPPPPPVQAQPKRRSQEQIRSQSPEHCQQFPENRQQRPENREQFPENRQQRPENREQFPENRQQRPENREQFPENRQQRPENREQFPENRQQRPENREQFPENRQQRPENREQFAENRHQRPENREQFPENRQQRPENREQFPENRQQRAEDREQFPENRQQRPENREQFPENRQQRPENREQFPENRQQRPVNREQFPENRQQRPENREQFPDNRQQRPENREQFPENRQQRPVNREQFPENRQQRPENREQFPENRQQRPENREQFPENRQHRPVNREQFPENRQQRPENREQFPENRQQRPDNREQFPENRRQRPDNREQFPEKRQQFQEDRQQHSDPRRHPEQRQPRAPHPENRQQHRQRAEQPPVESVCAADDDMELDDDTELDDDPESTSPRAVTPVSSAAPALSTVRKRISLAQYRVIKGQSLTSAAPVAYSAVSQDRDNNQRNNACSEGSSPKDVGGLASEEPTPPAQVRFISGTMAVCCHCGSLTEDLLRCQCCRKSLPADVTRIESTRGGAGFQRSQQHPPRSPGAQTHSPAGQLLPHLMAAGTTSVILQLGMPPTIAKPNFVNTRQRKKAPEEPECLTISSDEDDEERGQDEDRAQDEEDGTVFRRSLSSVSLQQSTPSEPTDDLYAGPVTGGGGCEDELDWEEEVRRVADGSLSGNYLSMLVRTVRVGSHRCMPTEPVLFTGRGFRFRLPTAGQQPRVVALTVPQRLVVKALVHLGQQLAALFLYLTPAAGPLLRRQLQLADSTDGPSFDPAGNNEQTKRLTVIFEEPMTDECRLTLLTILRQLGEQRMEEISSDETNSILLRSSPLPLALAVQNKYGVEDSVTTLLRYPPPPASGAIIVTDEDYLCLEEEQFLNDVIIDFYLKYLLDRLAEQDRKRTHVFSSFFYQRLTTRPSSRLSRTTAASDLVKLSAAEKRHARVKSWTKNVDIFDKDFLVVPINEHSHWFLAIICFPGLEGFRKLSDDSPCERPEPAYRRRKPPLARQQPSTPTSSAAVRTPTSTAGLGAVLYKIGSTLVVPVTDPSVLVAAAAAAPPRQDKPDSEVDSDRDEADGDDDDEDMDTTVEFPPAGPSERPNERPNDSPASSDLDECPLDSDIEPIDYSQAPPHAIKQPCILILDSLAGPSRSRVVATLRDYLRVEYAVKKQQQRPFDPSSMRGCCVRVSQQPNYSDCGLYVLQYAESFFQFPLMDFNLPQPPLYGWFPEWRAAHKRRHLAGLIERLTDEQFPGRVDMLPKLCFSSSRQLRDAPSPTPSPPPPPSQGAHNGAAIASSAQKPATAAPSDVSATPLKPSPLLAALAHTYCSDEDEEEDDEDEWEDALSAHQQLQQDEEQEQQRTAPRQQRQRASPTSTAAALVRIPSRVSIQWADDDEVVSAPAGNSTPCRQSSAPRSNTPRAVTPRPPAVPTLRGAAPRPPVLPTIRGVAPRPPVLPTLRGLAPRPPAVSTQRMTSTRPPTVPTLRSTSPRPPTVSTLRGSTPRPTAAMTRAVTPRLSVTASPRPPGQGPTTNVSARDVPVGTLRLPVHGTGARLRGPLSPAAAAGPGRSQPSNSQQQRRPDVAVTYVLPQQRAAVAARTRAQEVVPARSPADQLQHTAGVSPQGSPPLLRRRPHNQTPSKRTPESPHVAPAAAKVPKRS